MYKLEAQQVSKSFGRRPVLKDVTFSLAMGQSLAITGRNGSGKTTLLRLLAGLMRPSRGQVVFAFHDRLLSRREAQRQISYVGPELTLYDSLTAEENIRFFATMRGFHIGHEACMTILDSVQLKERYNDFYGIFSSGMKLRLKYGVALLGSPALLLLDEPMSNLDTEGKTIVKEIIRNQTKSGIVILATNEAEEYGFAERLYRVGD
jgi:heme exporter protein A